LSGIYLKYNLNIAKKQAKFAKDRKLPKASGLDALLCCEGISRIELCGVGLATSRSPARRESFADGLHHGQQIPECSASAEPQSA
jgi:hypothetical protein